VQMAERWIDSAGWCNAAADGVWQRIRPGGARGGGGRRRGNGTAEAGTGGLLLELVLGLELELDSDLGFELGFCVELRAKGWVRL
jgi:hypothetical protein